jgi:DNA topoisomerase-2
MLRDRLSGEALTLEGLTLQPWWFGFRGTVTATNEDTWITKGLYTMDDVKRTVTITELPVGTWTKDYKVFLDELASGDKAGLGDDGKPILKSFDDLYDDDTVNFILYFEPDYYEDIKADRAEFEKRFKLTTSWRLSNMTCFDEEMKIVKFSTVGDMVEAFFNPRLTAYEKRRQNEMARLEREALEADAKARFLQAILDGNLELRGASDEEIVTGMQINGLPPLSKMDSPDDVDSYDYLLRLRMDRVKASAVEDAQKAVMAARMAYETLRDTTASALWLSDLDEFEEAWNTMEAHRSAAMSSTGAPKKKRVGKK